jgi:hypothetical protein
MTQAKPPTHDPVLEAIENAPVDEAPMSDDERREIAEAKKGRFMTTAELRARLAAARSNPR